METQALPQTNLEPSVSTSSSSSSSSSSSCCDVVIPLSFSPITGPMQVNDWPFVLDNGEATAAGSMSEHLRFIDIDWTDVEKQFNRLASAGKGPEPVVNELDFGFCIGMQKSPEFANELLRALRGRREDHKIDITKGELHSYWHRMTERCFDSRMKIFFDMCDRNMDGRIDEMDIKKVMSKEIGKTNSKDLNNVSKIFYAPKFVKLWPSNLQAILLSASTNKLSLKHGELQEFAALIMEVLDTEGRGYIEASQLSTLFKASLPRGSNAPTYHKNDTYQDNASKAEILLRSHWRQAWLILFWLMVCFSLFTWKFIQYRRRMAFEVMGYCLCAAKGAAETLKLNMALVLLPVCRNTITWLRRNRGINSVVPFNDNINFHKLIAGGIVVGVILHGGTHLACDFPRISGMDSSIFQQTIAAQFGYHQPSYVQILATTEVATGIAMVILMAVTFLLATKWPRHQSPSLPRSIRHVTGYNTFWYSHHLFVLVYALLIVHSIFLFLTNDLIEKTTWMYIAIPVMLYTGERIFRAIRSGFYDVKILAASSYPGKVLSLKMHKPEGFKYKSGMYIKIQCPQISPFEWHPFSLTSGPGDDHLSVHIKTLGDWSYQISSLSQEAILSGVKEYPKIYMDGPYGAASQDHLKYDIIMLIGLGIGATPFISILKDVISGLQNTYFDNGACGECSVTRVPSKAYFYWLTREQSSFDWFRDIFMEISKSNQNQCVIEMHNFLTSVHQEGDARSAFVSAVQALHHAKHGLDMVSWTQVRTHFGRPNWFNIFTKLATRHRGERIGLFYCGPSALGRELETLCTKFSTDSATRFVFHKESY